RCRCADARDPAVRAVAHLGATADRNDLRHALDRGSGAARPPGDRAEGTPIEHSRDDYHRSAAAAHARNLARTALRRIARTGLGHVDAGGTRGRIPSRTLSVNKKMKL